MAVDKNRMRGVMVSFIVTNGLADTAERTRPVSVVVQMPNLGQRALQTCGGPPIDLNAPVATYVSASHSMHVTWNADADESGGERDVMRYAVWRHSEFDTQWHEPVASIPAGGGATYSYDDPTVQSGHTILVRRSCAGLHAGVLDSRIIRWDRCSMTPTSSGDLSMPNTRVREKRGVALMAVLLVTLAIVAIVIVASTTTLNARLISQNSERSTVLYNVAEGGIEEVRNILNTHPGDPTYFKDSGEVMVENHVPVTDASGCGHSARVPHVVGGAELQHHGAVRHLRHDHREDRG